MAAPLDNALARWILQLAGIPTFPLRLRTSKQGRRAEPDPVIMDRNTACGWVARRRTTTPLTGHVPRSSGFLSCGIPASTRLSASAERDSCFHF
jgi:hypothetical protein